MTADTAKHLLQRFYLDYVAFLYQVNPIALKNSLSTTSLACKDDFDSDDDLKKPSPPTSGILTHAERVKILYLSRLVREVVRKVAMNQLSLITRTEIDTINSQIILPVEQLNMDVALTFDLLRGYAEHKGIDRRKAGHHGRYPIARWLGWFMLHQDQLARRVVDDDMLVDRMAPNEQTRLLLGSAVARFGERYWKNRNKEPWRPWITPTVEEKLKKVVKEKAAVMKWELAQESGRKVGS